MLHATLTYIVTHPLLMLLLGCVCGSMLATGIALILRGRDPYYARTPSERRALDNYHSMRRTMRELSGER